MTLPRRGRVRGIAGDVARGARAGAVFGRPVAHGGVLVIPVARTRFAVGGGGGGRRGGESGEGGGGAAVVRPAGYIELRGGRARYRGIRGVSGPATVVTVVVLALLAWRATRPSPPSPVPPTP